MWALVFVGYAVCALQACAVQMVAGDNHAPLTQGAHKPGVNVVADYSPQQRAELGAMIESVSDSRPKPHSAHHVPVPHAKPQLAAKHRMPVREAAKSTSWLQKLEFWR